MTATRRLAAILAADVAGYSRLMGADEGGTLRGLKAIRAELIDPKIAAHNGRLVKTTGDGLLVEFGSVVDALRYATEVQAAIAERNATEDTLATMVEDAYVDRGSQIHAGCDLPKAALTSPEMLFPTSNLIGSEALTGNPLYDECFSLAEGNQFLSSRVVDILASGADCSPPGGPKFCANGREPGLLIPRQPRRAVVIHAH
jgi:hypothetical protein